jgi:putative ABC transport system permease protein
MMRSKGGYILIALQIAVTMAIMVNAIAIMQERGSKMARPSGLDEANTFAFVSVGFAPDMNNKALINEDLDNLRSLPGVKHVTASNSFPLRQSGWSEGLHREPGVGKSVSSSAIYFVDEHGLDTFGLELIDGENFAPEQVGWDSDTDDPWPATVIVSQALGLQSPWQGWAGVERAMLVPQRRDSEFVRYIVRTEPGYRDELMVQAEELLASSNKDRIIRNMVTVDEVRKLAYLGDAAMIKILTFVVALLTAITGLGLVGLASFSVARRTRQIGIRRALGATKAAIVRYFMLENFVVSSIGIVAGGILAVGLNIFMVQAFSLTPLAWYVIPIAMVVLWVVGQLAVAGPARKASNISPAIATRSV